MRICLLSARFPPQRCGVGDYTYYLGCALAERGHDVHALTSTGALDAIRYPLPRRFTAHRVIDAWDVRRVPSIMRHVIKLRPDVLLIEYTPHAFDRRGLTLAVNLVPLLTRFVPNTRVVTNFHELYMPLRGPVPHRVAAAWQRVAALGTAATSQGVCVTAPLWKRLLRGLGVRKSIGVIPVGSNIPRVAMTAEERRDIRRDLLPDGDGMLIAGFGALHDRDLGLVAEALAYLKHERRARLIWIGGGDGGRQSRDSVARQFRERGLAEGALLWTGVIPHHEVSKLLAACDVMTLPFVDGLSSRRTSAISAMQHSLPLLTTRGEDLEACFVHETNVYLVPTGDRAGFCDGLRHLAGDASLRARIARGGRALYESAFSWKIIAQKVLRLLEAA